MIEEAYVSFEVAKLLKEKGFDEKCFALYSPDGILIQSGIRLNNTQVSKVKGSYSAPTIQMSMRWLREIHNISIEISSFWNGSNDDSYKFSKYTYGFRVDTPNFTDRYRKSEFDTYEDAVEVAIKYCLKNLI